jgi:hypothetical protein
MPKFCFLWLLCWLLLGSNSLASPIYYQSSMVQSHNDAEGREYIALGELTALGIGVESTSTSLALSWATMRLDFVSASGWLKTTDSEVLAVNLPNIIEADGQRWVALEVLAQFGFVLEEQGATTVISPPLAAADPAPTSAVMPPRLTAVRFSQNQSNNADITRVVLDLSHQVQIQSQQLAGRVSVRFLAVISPPLQIPQASRLITNTTNRYRLVKDEQSDGVGLLFELDTIGPSQSTVSTLKNPARIVIETSLPKQNASPPGPLPSGASLLVRERALANASLYLLSLDPMRFQPRVVSAPWGVARSVLAHVELAGAKFGVNGGYFDPASNLAVDLLLSGGETRAYARGNRATLGLSPGGLVFGTPKLRLSLSVAGKTIALNTIHPNPFGNPERAKWVSGFIGDGFWPVGGLGLTVLLLDQRQQTVEQKYTEAVVPKLGQFALIFDAAQRPDLDLAVGSSMVLGQSWSDPTWNSVTEAVAAGPWLVRNGQYAVNAIAEGFDITATIWRPTRQVAFGLDGRGQYVLAFLEYGSPEDFAKLLVKEGIQQAMRMDSGSSGVVVAAAGILGAEKRQDFLGRNVPNALVFIERQ